MTNAARTEEVATGDAQFNTAYIYAVSIVAALGGLLFGYDWVVIGGVKPFYEKYFGLTDPSQQGWAMSCALVGCLIGVLMRQFAWQVSSSLRLACRRLKAKLSSKSRGCGTEMNRKGHLE